MILSAFILFYLFYFTSSEPLKYEINVSCVFFAVTNIHDAIVLQPIDQWQSRPTDSTRDFYDMH